MSRPASVPLPRIGPAIVAGGLACGILDLIAAFVLGAMAGVGPGRVLQSIASAVLGAASYDGGLGTMALGLALHFFVAFGAATAFCLAAWVMPALLRRPWPAGLACGIGVYLVMNVGVLPLCSWFRHLMYGTPAVFAPRVTATGVFVHLVCVGLPIAFAARRAMR